MCCRITPDKGIQTAIETCRALGAKLKIAGVGDKSKFNTQGVDVEWVGIVDKFQRDKLIGNAIALFSPSQYAEPFGSVAIEAMFSGTPVLTTDFGAYAETIVDGVNGWKCHTLGEYAFSAMMSAKLDRAAVRGYAESRWSMDVVKRQYQTYFQRLNDQWGSGWNTMADHRWYGNMPDESSAKTES